MWFNGLRVQHEQFGPLRKILLFVSLLDTPFTMCFFPMFYHVFNVLLSWLSSDDGSNMLNHSILLSSHDLPLGPELAWTSTPTKITKKLGIYRSKSRIWSIYRFYVPTFYIILPRRLMLGFCLAAPFEAVKITQPLPKNHWCLEEIHQTHLEKYLSSSLCFKLKWNPTKIMIQCFVYLFWVYFSSRM